MCLGLWQQPRDEEVAELQSLLPGPVMDTLEHAISNLVPAGLPFTTNVVSEYRLVNPATTSPPTSIHILYDVNMVYQSLSME